MIKYFENQFCSYINFRSDTKKVDNFFQILYKDSINPTYLTCQKKAYFFF